MLPPSRRLDPQGYYARLGVEPGVTQEAITHAFRLKARILHPDVPKTGSQEAFIALRAAYDVLSNPARRTAYDEAARTAAVIPPPPPPPPPMTHGVHDFRPDVAGAPWADVTWLDDDPADIRPGFTPKPSEPVAAEKSGPNMFILASGGIAVLLCVGLVQAALHLRTAPQAVNAGISPNAAPVAPQSEAAQRAALYGPAPMHLAGVPNFYVTPSAGSTMMWRLEGDHNRIAPIGQLTPFSTVQALRVNAQTGLVEIRFDDTTNAFVESRHLAPGDAAAARRAYCSYNSGPVPYDGEVLARHGQGSGTIRIENRALQPAVVKLRDGQGAVAEAVFLGPNGSLDLSDAPAGPFQAEYAIGELWSRACNSFAAGMRAERLNDPLPLRGETLVLPTDSLGATDISDRAFEQP